MRRKGRDGTGLDVCLCESTFNRRLSVQQARKGTLKVDTHIGKFRRIYTEFCQTSNFCLNSIFGAPADYDSGVYFEVQRLVDTSSGI